MTKEKLTERELLTEIGNITGQVIKEAIEDSQMNIKFILTLSKMDEDDDIIAVLASNFDNRFTAYKLLKLIVARYEDDQAKGQKENNGKD